jgi:RNA polymerase sigma-70 factor (ECF subfamily)
MRMTGNRAVAEDLAQESFLHAFERLDQYKGAGTFRSWLCRVAYTKMLMALRKRASESRMREAVSDVQTAGATQEAGPEAVLDLDRALAALDELERAALVLSYAADFSHPEIADALNLPLGTVKSHISCGRTKLRRPLSPE